MEDGALRVYGKATDETLDSDRQIVDLQWASKAMQKWLATGGNLRVQHNPSRDPAGVGVGIEVKSDGVYITGEVIEPVASRLVEKGALRAFSVGIHNAKIVTDPMAPQGRIKGGEIVEVSLVDRPANPSCVFSLVKSVDGVATVSGILEKKDNDGDGDDDADDDTDSGDDSDDDSADDEGDDKDGDNDGDSAQKASQATSSDDASSNEAHQEAGALGKGADDERSEAASVDEYALRRLHDATCPAYSVEALKAAYPAIEQAGLPGVINEAARGILYTVFTKTITDDAGSGQFADLLEHLAKAYRALQAPATAVVEPEQHATKMASAHDELRKACGIEDTADPDDEKREKGSRVFYTNDHRDAATAAMQEIHNTIAKLFPAVCTLTLSEVADPVVTLATTAKGASDEDAATAKKEAKALRAELKKQKKIAEKQARKAKKLEAEVQKLGSQPDMTGVTRVPAGATVKTVALAEAQKREEDNENQERIDWLRGLVRTGTPQESSAALDVLTRMGLSI